MLNRDRGGVSSLMNSFQDNGIAFIQQPLTQQFSYPYYGLPPGSVMRGSRINGSMSPIRRFFCLFVTFDLLLTCLLWFITLVIEGNFDFNVVFQQQILHYHIKTSMFDIIMASATRFVALLLFYGFLQIQHWIIVALTTASTGLLLVTKVYIYDWGDASTQVLKVVLILSSFILSWAEAWLLDIKVFPQEKFAQDYLSSIQSASSFAADERAPLLNHFLRSQQNLDIVSDSMGSFYSPLPSSDDSADEGDTSTKRLRRGVPSSVTSINEFIKKATEFHNLSWMTLNNDGWIFEKVTAEGDTIESEKDKDGRKIFRLVGSLPVRIEDLVRILFFDIEAVPSWNPTVKESKVLQALNSETDICYQLSKQFGLVKGREYVLLRHFKVINGNNIISSASIPWPKESDEAIIRGELGPSCWAFKAIGIDRSDVRWLLDCQVKGWIPAKVVESSIPSVMEEYMSFLRRYLTLSPSFSASNPHMGSTSASSPHMGSTSSSNPHMGSTSSSP